MENNEYYYSLDGKYLYTGLMDEDDRLATKDEVTYWLKNGSTLEADIKTKLEENTKAYNSALSSPLSCGVYLVLPEWVNTYSNTLQYAQRAESKGVSVSANIVVLKQDGELSNIIVTSLAEFEPFYDIVADEWARITDKRNVYLCEIQNSSSPKSILIDYSSQ